MKACLTCNEQKPLTAFWRHSLRKDGRSERCSKCMCEARQAFKRSNYPEYIAKERKHKLKRTFGITPEQYTAWLQDQGGKCAICRVPQDSLPRAMAVDHCHISGAIRGLLCSNCNTGIGNLRDSVFLLNAAIKYLSLAPRAVAMKNQGKK